MLKYEQLGGARARGRRQGSRWLLLALLWPAAAPLSAACPAEREGGGKPSWVTNFYFENDLFDETDQNYTNGIRFSALSPDLDSFTDDPQLAGWVVALNRAMGFLAPGSASDCLQSRRLVLSLGQSIYTPEDINATAVVPDQRPYAGWLYAGVAYNLRRANRLDTVGLTVGVVGPASLAHQTQDGFHKLRGFARFQGWDNQLDNEPGLQLVWEQKRKWGAPRMLGFWGSDLIVHAGVSFGNIATYLNSGAEWRLGWDLPDDFGTSALRPGADNGAPGRDWHASGTSRRRGAHLFASVDGRWVLRDIFLDGNTFSSSHRVDKKPLVADLAVGAALEFGNLSLSYAQVLRTQEFTAQPNSQVYGSLSLSWARPF